LFVVAVLLAGGMAAAHGQSALDGFDPNANGQVWVIVVQADGKILIGGDFTTVLGVARNNIARLNADGTLDTAFDPNATSFIVYALAVQADGKILVGGVFSNMGGQPRSNIARLDAMTGAADSFDPNANNNVYAIAVQTDGKILVGGFFTGIGAQPRLGFARLDATTGLADSFNPSGDFAAVYTIAVQADGKILAGGGFTNMGGQSRNGMARLDPTTGLADSFNPNANNNVYAIAVQADGKILAGGAFRGANGIGGQTRNYIARLDPVTGLADSFDPNANGGLGSIVVQADGKILVGGRFNGPNSIGGQTRNGIARLDAKTGLADSFDPKTNNPVYTVAVQADGKILTGGQFDMLAPNGGPAVTRNHIARLETDGRLDQTLDLGTIGDFGQATAVQADGKILIGGEFTTVLGVARNNIARLNTDGTLDLAFNPNSDSNVYAIAVQSDGKILAGGTFSNIGGQPRSCIARLNPATGLADSFDPHANGGRVDAIAVQPDGKIVVAGAFHGAAGMGGQLRNRIARLDPTTGLADSFNPNADSVVFSVALQADGKVLAGGTFSNIGGQPRTCIARLDATTGLADSFDPNPSPSLTVYSIAVQPDGKILVGGSFNNIGGQPRNRLARLDPTTGLADSFDPNSNGSVYSIAVQGDGKILVGGTFTGGISIGGQVRNYIARLDPTTGAADSFDPNSSSTVYSIALQADGKVMVGGFFLRSNIGGQTRSLFARLSNDTAAFPNLVVTQNIITWTRGGSSPQFSRATFESSTDNTNYTPLGNAAAAGSSWSLAGLNLPTGQNFYIRARGYSGNAFCESVTESVRNSFLKPLRISAVTRSSNDFVVTFDAVIGSTYRLERKLSLADANWQSIAGVSDLTANATVAQFTDPNALSLGKAFYRVRLLP
jgi:uncharacterized delta-60 repeat protein